MIYKKLFNIKLNNKEFGIFVDANHRRTFLEKKGNDYYYPTIEDFLKLHHLYNEKNYLIKYSSFKFKEMIRTMSGALAIVTVLNMAGCSNNNFKIKESNDEEIIISNEYNDINNYSIIDGSESEKQVVYIKDINELNDILGYNKVTPEMVRSVINTYPNFKGKYKVAALQTLDDMLEIYPDIDLRIFYENMKGFSFEEIDFEDLRSEKNIDALFNGKEKKIVTYSDATLKTLCHEFNHAFYNFYCEKDNTVYIRSVTFGDSLEEAMTEKLTVDNINDGVYKDERYVLDFILNNIDFTIEDYENKGIWYLIELIKNSYSKVDIDLIIDSLDARMDSRLNKDKIIMEIPDEMMHELFDLCLSNIDLSNPYSSFANFSYMAHRLGIDIFPYLEKYNEILKENGINRIIDKEYFLNYYNKYSVIENYLVIKGEGIIPIIKRNFDFNFNDNSYKSTYITIDGEGNRIEKEQLNDENILETFYLSSLYDYIFKYEQYLGTDEFWNAIIKNENICSTHLYQKIPIYYNNKLLATNYTSNIKIILGETYDNNLGYIVKDEDNIIFQSHDNYKYLTNESNLEWLLNFNNNNHEKDIKEIDLKKILNEDFLRKFADGVTYYNLSLKNNKLFVVPKYMLSIPNYGNIELRRCYLYKQTDTFNGIASNYLLLFIGEGIIDITFLLNPDNMDDSYIFFDDILKYYNLLDENKLYYEFTDEQIIDLFVKYINEKNSNLLR